MVTFSYHNVMPEFLDFLSSFGKHTYSQDFQIGGFRERTCLTSPERALQVPGLGRSGRDIRLCYSLRSVEPSESQTEWPWSIRQTAVHHSFDVEIGRAAWFVVKGNELIKRRFRGGMSRDLQGPRPYSDTGKAFASSLTAHLTFCEWSNEHWRWYITFLEERLQSLTRHALSMKVEKSANPIAWEFSTPTVKQRPAEGTDYKVAAMERRYTQLSSPTSAKTPREETVDQPLPPDMRGPSIAHTAQTTCLSGEELSFTDLQKTQNIQEQAKNALLTIKVNAAVLVDLREHYQLLAQTDELPEELLMTSGSSVSSFGKKLRVIEKDFLMHLTRLDALLDLLADRKGLVCANSSPLDRSLLNFSSYAMFWSTITWRQTEF